MSVLLIPTPWGMLSLVAPDWHRLHPRYQPTPADATEHPPDLTAQGSVGKPPAARPREHADDKRRCHRG